MCEHCPPDAVDAPMTKNDMLAALGSAFRMPEPRVNLFAFGLPSEPLCEWFAGCDRPADGHVHHPILGPVPTCERCADKLGLEFMCPEW